MSQRLQNWLMTMLLVHLMLVASLSFGLLSDWCMGEPRYCEVRIIGAIGPYLPLFVVGVLWHLLDALDQMPERVSLVALMGSYKIFGILLATLSFGVVALESGHFSTVTSYGEMLVSAWIEVPTMIALALVVMATLFKLATTIIGLVSRRGANATESIPDDV